MVAFPPCKINLGLHILSRRTDGYHDLDTCFYPLPWTDVLELLPSASISFVQTGRSIPGAPDDNLCLKAYHLLRKGFDLPPVQIHLHKIIPTGAGLGGGSADAAYTLKLLNDVCKLNLSIPQLKTYAAMLGSDCAFFVDEQPMLGSGRGEVLEPISLNLKGYYLVLVKPDIHMSTAQAYRNVAPRQPVNSVHNIVTLPIESWKGTLVNDFEGPVFRRYPSLQAVKDELYAHGALYASMSGSGSSIFGIFKTVIDLKAPFKDALNWSGWL